MKVVISGYGKMGKMIESVLIEKKIDYLTTEDVKSIDKNYASEAVCIDFTTPDSFKANYKFLADTFKSVVVGTTGWQNIYTDVTSYFLEKNATLIYASNFSIGVNILFKLTQLASGMLKEMGNYDPYIVEYHHNQKLDSPSGTAKTLSKIVSDSYGSEINISSVRAGNIPGIHAIGFESEIDRITLKHEAFSRSGFAIGAVNAAIWSLELNGIHEFMDLIESKLNRIINNSISQKLNS